MESLVNIGIILSYVMVAFAALTAVGFGVKKMMQNTNNDKKTLYTAGGLVVAFIIAYLLASDEVLGFITVDEYSVPEVKNEIVASSAKNVGMGLTAFYLLAIGAIGAVSYAEFSKVFSK